MTTDLKTAVINASEKWKAAFNSGDAAGCAACYEADAVMVATPFGTYTGHSEIQSFWQNLIDNGFTDVDYLDPDITVLDDTSVLLTSGWKMNKAHGVITRELWVLQDDGTMALREDHFEAQG
ncbi:isochorismatase [Kiloniella litopenaei]|uniref:Isochorismatase n=1 Tax=Kiloniella litopenaei TaxID=1549748 RepID=A0A0M2RAT7_9PROT|nr:nuclear transport factor 2 family protein [Kiloniella litopenaei]KKJ78761.1 isochorismatase [Kiloniella litopenaei]